MIIENGDDKMDSGFSSNAMGIGSHTPYTYEDSIGVKHVFQIPRQPRNFDVDKICVVCHEHTRTNYQEMCRRGHSLTRRHCYGKLIPLYQLKWEMQKWR